MTYGTTTKLKSTGGRSVSRQPDPQAATPRKFLPEVQGLRALAVLMVVAYHVWFGRISGGVDVFLLISAFLMTGQFTRRLEKGQTLDLLKYWAHLFKRLLPLIAITLVASLIGTYLLLPETRWHSIIGQTWASLFYYQNWFLASEAVDYYATDHSIASPLQHFWSLSIQGQIFIIWPLIFVIAAVIAHLGKIRIRALLIYIFGAVFAFSLLYSIITTANNQALAYFDTRARLWEFALGSLLALALPSLRWNRLTRIFLGWLGIVGMLSCGLILQVGQQFPGYMALWPTLAAACIIVAGFTDSKFSADRFLSWKPLVKLGDSSYALYLFHWPLLVIYLVWSGRDHAGPRAGLAIILVSIAAAWALTKWIDTPLRRNKWIEQKKRRALTVILVCIAVVAVPLGGWQVQIHAANQAAMAESARNNPGAASLLPGFVNSADPNAPLQPSLNSINTDGPIFPQGCETNAEKMTFRCANGTEDGAKNIVVLGSSHANLWNTAIFSMAEKNHWAVTSIVKGLCPLGADTTAGDSEECVEFNQDTLSEVIRMKPDLVVTTSTRTDYAAGIPERVDPGWVSEVGALNASGIQVLAIRDTPRFSESVPTCIEKNADNLAACAVPRTDLFAPEPPTDTIEAELPGTKFLDFTDYFCPAGTCPAVIGNVIVYMDGSHVTATYMGTLAPIFEREFQTATGWSMK